MCQWRVLVGQRQCDSRFSEISILYLGTDAQRNANKFDEFSELDFPVRECRGVSKVVLMLYDIMVCPHVLCHHGFQHKTLQCDSLALKLLFLESDVTYFNTITSLNSI